MGREPGGAEPRLVFSLFVSSGESGNIPGARGGGRGASIAQAGGAGGPATAYQQHAPPPLFPPEQEGDKLTGLHVGLRQPRVHHPIPLRGVHLSPQYRLHRVRKIHHGRRHFRRLLHVDREVLGPVELGAPLQVFHDLWVDCWRHCRVLVLAEDVKKGSCDEVRGALKSGASSCGGCNEEL